MLRIAELESDALSTLRVEGKIVGPWVREIEASCSLALARGGRVALDLALVSFVDAAGLAVVRELSKRGVTIVRCSPFVAAQLKGAAP
jgi:hypothetical protein